MKRVELKSTSALRVLAAAMVFGVAACSGGGGGGGSSTPPVMSPPPPPPSNAAPAAVVNVDKSAPDEGQPFIIDASGSTDADGDALKISIEQISGPAAGDAPEGLELPSADGAFGFSAPEVDADQVLTFEVTVSEDDDATVETVEVTATNIVLEPLANVFEANPFEIVGLNTVEEIESVADSGFGSFSILAVDRDASGSVRLHRFTSNFDGTYEPGQVGSLSSPIDGSLIYKGITGFSGGAFSLLGDVENNSLKVITNTFGEPWFEEADSLDSQNPCAIGEDNVRFYNLIPPISVFVGERGTGLKRFEGHSGSSRLDNAPVQLLDSGEICAFAKFNQYLVVIDYSDWTYRVLEQTDILDYSIGSKEPIGVVARPGEKIVDARAFYLTGGPGFALLATNGNHDSEHRLIVLIPKLETALGGDFIGEFDVVERTWEKGVPLRITQFGGGADVQGLGEAFAISFSTSPYVGIFGINSNFSTGLNYEISEISYLEVGLGQTDVSGEFGSLAVAMGSKGEIKAFYPLPASPPPPPPPPPPG